MAFTDRPLGALRDKRARANEEFSALSLLASCGWKLGEEDAAAAAVFHQQLLERTKSCCLQVLPVKQRDVVTVKAGRFRPGVSNM